jgi:hypothetical protein
VITPMRPLEACKSLPLPAGCFVLLRVLRGKWVFGLASHDR